jgi:hypothetical protein
MPSLNAADMASRTGPMAKKNWIKKAVPKERRGVFKAKAEAAGESTAAFAKKHEGDKGTLGKEARLAENLMSMGKRKKSPLYDHPRSRKD